MLWCCGVAAALSTLSLAMSDFAVFIMFNGRERGQRHDFRNYPMFINEALDPWLFSSAQHPRLWEYTAL